MVIKDLTLQFIPYSEIVELDSSARVKKILGIILKNKIVILQGKLKPEEETRLIEDTMALVGNVKGFKGVELAVISGTSNGLSIMGKIRQGLANALAGQRDALTVIGPASIVKEIKRDPKKMELMLKK